GRRAERRLLRGEQRGGLIAILAGELARRRAELHRDPVRVVGVDRGAPAVVDANALETEIEQTLESDLQVVEVVGAESDVIRPRRQAEAGRDLPAVLGGALVVDVPHGEELAVAGVVEEVPRPARLGRGGCFDLYEIEAHGLG